MEIEIREREVRNEAPLPHPQVSGGLGLGYMATSHAFLILVIQKLEISCETCGFI